MVAAEARQRIFPLAIAQLPITGDARENGANVRRVMREAAIAGARLVQFPEGMLSGYAKNPITDWAQVNWTTVHDELERIAELAAELRLWVVLGSAHPLTPPHWPHNSLYVISDDGKVVDRYDKRKCSATETLRFYTPGSEPVVFEVDGFRFGCIICVEINFPQLFMDYSLEGVDCVLLSAYPEDSIFFTKAVAHAAIENYWVSLSIPSERKHLMKSALIGPDGAVLRELDADEGLLIGELNRSDPNFDVALNKARPWRAVASSGEYYAGHLVEDPRSSDKTCL